MSTLGIMSRVKVTVRTSSGRVPGFQDADVRLDIGANLVSWLEVFVSDDSWDHYVKMTLLFSISEVRYLVRSVEVGVDSEVKLQSPAASVLDFRENNLHEINSVLLRQVRVGEIARVGVSGGVFVQMNDGEPAQSLLSWFGPEGEPQYAAGEIGDVIRNSGPVDRNLQLVAQSYMIAQLSSQPPAKAVERQFGLPPRTAANWIAKAKSSGFIRQPKVLP